MAEEVVDTTPKIYPTGNQLLTCEKVEKKISDKGSPYYVFHFYGLVEDKHRTHKEFRQPWMAGDLILALGGKAEKPGVYKWDRALVQGNQIRCEIVHEPDYKDKSRTRASIKNPTKADATSDLEEMPF